VTSSFSISANVTSVKQTYTQSQAFYTDVLNIVINNTNKIEASLPKTANGNVSTASFNQPIPFVEAITKAPEVIVNPEGGSSFALKKKITFVPLLSILINIFFMFFYV